MSTLQPPRVATWLFERAGSGSSKDALLGDLIDQYREGRPRGWYWRQALIALAVDMTTGVRAHRSTVVRVVVMLGLLTGVIASGHGPTIDLQNGLRVEIVSSGWSAADLVDGRRTIGPAVSFRLRNVSDQPLTHLEVNAFVRRIGDKDACATGFFTTAGLGGLAPQATTDTLAITATHSYTSLASDREMLQHSQFVDRRSKYSPSMGTRQRSGRTSAPTPFRVRSRRPTVVTPGRVR